MKKISPTVLTDFINSRNTREKIFFMFLFIVIILAIDFVILVQPVINLFMNELPKKSLLKQQLAELKDDEKNAAQIEKNYEATKVKYDAVEKSFILHDQVPELLQNLSQLASSTGVRIVSLNPLDEVKSDKIPGFSLLPIQIKALGGTHELGHFLAKLEGGTTYFRVSNLAIHGNEGEPRRHDLSIDIETYRKG